jgi:hypothetical protein
MKNFSALGLANGGCIRSPSKKHVLYEGSEKSKYICKYCGMTNNSIAGLTGGGCHKSPTKRHEPAL